MENNKDDYLTTYREFFEEFAKTVNPNDQLPVKLASYKLVNVEVVGGVIDWTTQYLTQKNCPPYLLAFLIKTIIEEIRKACKKDPLAFGFNPQENAYEPLKLMQAVMAKTNEVCLRYQDNSVLCSLPRPQNTCFVVSAHAVRNRRKKMEDRHVVIHDLSTMFNIQDCSPSSYYAVFDGHAGHDAAAYSSAHLHQYLAENKHFATDPKQALLDAFCKTDALFLEKCKVENLGSGTTALVALLRPKEKTLYIAWAGDSLALLVNQGRILQCVNPHKPCREDEKERVHQAGGACMMWGGVWRVNGQLAISRAIGDAPYKPFVTAVPDIREISLDGGEDFLILACDGLWDHISEDAAAQEVYYLLAENSDDTERISKHLVQLSRYKGSTDNISVIVVFLREPSKIAADAPRWATRPTNKMDVDMDQHGGQLDNQFANSNGASNDILLQKQQQTENLLLNLVDNINKSNGADFNGSILDPARSPASNGTHQEFHHDDFHHDDFGPETDVDAVDDVIGTSVISPVEKTKNFQDALLGNSALENAKAIHDAILGNNSPFEGQYNPFLQDHEKAELETDVEIQGLDRQQSRDSEDGQRDETPTPPLETVQESAEVEEINQDSDSEDEWNFIKGDEAKKGTLASQPETVVESAEEDAMSQLNPNAAEFVPVSPTRSIPSPACRLPLINDEVIAQSPKRPVQMDLKLPDENDFENEVKSRPSDVEALNNGHHSDSDLDTTPKDPMEVFLNGKTVDDIPEFLPSSVDSTPTKPQSNDEFHFGPNAAPYTPKVLDQSEAASSTRAVFGDESTATLDMTQFSESQDFNLANKENTDPMNMSFSEERGDINPFNNQDDLNKIHVLPENLDEFLNSEENKENIHDFTISDLPEHFPLGTRANNDEAVKTTDLDHEEEKELASPLEPELQQEIEEREPSNTPQPTHENLLGDFEGELREPMPDLLEGEPKIEAELVTKEEMTMDLIQEAQNHFENKEVLTPTNEESRVESPLACELRSDEQLCPIQQEKDDLAGQQEQPQEPLVCPVRNEEPPVCELPPEQEKENPQNLPEPEESLPEYQANDVFNSEPVPKSLDFELLDDKSPINDSPSPACEFRAPSAEPVCDFRAPSGELKSPVQEVKSFAVSPVPLDENIEVLQDQKSLTEDVTSSVKDDISSPVSPIKSPGINESFNLALDDSQSEANQQEAKEVTDLIHEEFQSCELPNLNQPEVCPLPIDLNFNGGPVIPNDQINNFLDHAQNQFENQFQEISEQIQIKTDNIVPEFAQQEVITPSDESKGLDVVAQEVPAATLVEPPVQEPISPLVKHTPKSEETPKTEPETPKDSKKEVKEEAKKSSSKKPLGKATPASKPAAPKVPAPKTGSATKTSNISPRLPAKTGTTPAAKAPITKSAAPSLSDRTAAPPKPKTSPAPRPAAAKPLLNGDVKTASRTGVAAKKPSESTLSKTTARPPLSKTSPVPKTSTSRPATAPKVPTAAPRTAATTARPTSGISKTASATAPKLKPAVSSTRNITSTTRSLTTTATSKVTSTVSKTATSPKPAATAPKPKTITSAPKPTKVPPTKTVTKNAELEKQNKESANKLTASKSTTLTSTRTANVAGAKTSSTTVKKTETKPLSNRNIISKTTTTTTTKSTLGKKPAEIKSTTKTKTTKVEKPKQNGISATIVTEEIMVNNVVNETVNSLLNTDILVNNVVELDSNLLKDNSPIDNKLIDNLIEVNGAD